MTGHIDQNGRAPIEELVGRLHKKGKDSFENLPLAGFVVLVILLMFWLASGIYIIEPDEVGLVLRFGKLVRASEPGPHWHLPYPIEKVEKVAKTRVHRVEIGFETIDPGPPARFRAVPEESEMLTEDGNIIHLDLAVQYVISSPVDYSFNMKSPDMTVKEAAEAVIREIVGRKTMDDVLTTKKGEVQDEAQVLLQALLDHYGSGIEIQTVKLQDVEPPSEVNAAFKDVVSAKEDKERTKNQAEVYANDIIPRAKGQAQKLRTDAEAYREAQINKAKGETARFLKILEEYRKAPEITKIRLYIEAMESILPHLDKVIIDNRASSNMLPLMPLTLTAPKGMEKTEIPGEHAHPAVDTRLSDRGGQNR